MTDMIAKKDFRALRRKLASGKTIDEAAAESGMTLEEAQAYLTAREDVQDKALLAFSDQAMETALKVLTRAAREKNRSVSLTTFDGDGGGHTITKEQVLDVDAAKALLKAAMQAKKMLREEKIAAAAADTGQNKDLFDTPWTFKKSD